MKYSWWHDTRWEDIQCQVKVALSKREYTEWLKRPDVRERCGF